MQHSRGKDECTVYSAKYGILLTMSKTLLPASDDAPHDDQRSLKARKEKNIKPLGKTATHSDIHAGVKKEAKKPEQLFETPQEKDYDGIPRVSDDLLEELRQKTAALAAKIDGPEDPKNRTLKLSENDVQDDAQLLKSLKDDTNQIDQPADERTTAIEPGKELPGLNPAAKLVRDKLSRLYASEPNAEQEASEVQHIGRHRSKHQQYMYELTTSGKPLVDIQTQWHEYYTALPDNEKHEVWQEFYSAQSSVQPVRESSENLHLKKKSSKLHHPRVLVHPQASARPIDLTIATANTPLTDNRPSAGEIKQQLLQKVSSGGKLTAKHHAKSLLFGLSLAAGVFFVTSFILYNDVYIAPFISPGRSVSATPIIGNNPGEVGPDPQIIIPKINLEVPVVFDLNSIAERDIQNALENGVVHMASTPKPGEVGNSVIVGHSSNNIFNSGKYKFAFVLLKRLEIDDTFFVNRNGTRYTYKVYRKEIVSPDTVSVLETQDKPNTITLITCDPPGTSLNRLIITGEQISPDPSTNTESTAADIQLESSEPLPSNAPSLWSRIWPF